MLTDKTHFEVFFVVFFELKIYFNLCSSPPQMGQQREEIVPKMKSIQNVQKYITDCFRHCNNISFFLFQK